jgi:hypothetical protein
VHRLRHRGERVYKWELDKGDESRTIAVHGSLLLDDVDLESGALIRVLEDWCPAFPGFFVYYPTRKQQPSALTALITTLRLVG